ncbi:hypothetical protein [Noviherbaspirillum sp. UKPF54]|uniref:hypothetical protein n=1 Tax=Noviherbaspirillum sp. UKPF54 TaxID=2601898 RepID=UPI0011B1535C|nr:hypothetical protein [Noviherbaspirillum sp. UKPF54]QDZ29279.1 hypothetical protein FAY22_15685 [Noviherbaspirillum sp. UKPF54]
MKPITLLLVAAAALLAGCGEPDQTKTTGNTNRHDTAPWQGAKDPYVVKGWTPGNQGSWENQIRSRGQMQNEYVKTN